MRTFADANCSAAPLLRSTVAAVLDRVVWAGISRLGPGLWLSVG